MTSLEMTREPVVNRRIAQIFNKISRITRTSIQDESLTIARPWGPLWGATRDLTAIDRFRSLRRGAGLLWGPSTW